MSKTGFVCFCVDGPSDIDALRQPFEDLFDQIGHDNIEVKFRYAEFQNKNHGDITSLDGVTPDNIEKYIYKYYFKNRDKKSELGWDDVTTIIHIIDIDGAYVSRDKISFFSSGEEKMADDLTTNGSPKNTLYLEDHIAVRHNPDGRYDTIRRKRQNIEYLLDLSEITVGKKRVRYFLYFFSSNLDHYLYGDANLTGADKMRQAASFADRIIDADALVDFFNTSEYSCKCDYVQSWRDLSKGVRSLSRGTNVNLLIDKIQNSTLEDWL